MFLDAGVPTRGNFRLCKVLSVLDSRVSFEQAPLVYCPPASGIAGNSGTIGEVAGDPSGGGTGAHAHATPAESVGLDYGKLQNIATTSPMILYELQKILYCQSSAGAASDPTFVHMIYLDNYYCVLGSLGCYTSHFFFQLPPLLILADSSSHRAATRKSVASGSSSLQPPLPAPTRRPRLSSADPTADATSPLPLSPLTPIPDSPVVRDAPPHLPLPDTPVRDSPLHLSRSVTPRVPSPRPPAPSMSRSMSKLEFPKLSEDLSPAVINGWLGRCEDTYEAWQALNPEKLMPPRTVITLAGLRMEERTAATWWNENRDALKKLGTWELFAEKVKERFVPSNWRLVALAAFYGTQQGFSPFPEFVKLLQDTRNMLYRSIWTAAPHPRSPGGPPMPPTAPSHPCGYARTPEPLIHSQLMVVYPASWSICIIGPAWSLIALYFTPALALRRIGTPVGSQTLPAPSGCLPNAPSALRDLIRALCNYSRYSEPFACLRLRFCDFGPALCLCQFIDPARIPTLAPRYTDGTPRAHPSSVQPSSVFRALRLLATNSLCLRHRFQPGFTLHHPRTRAHLCAAPSALWCGCPRPFWTNARSQPIAFSRLLRYWSVNFGASLSFISFRSWSLAAHPRTTRQPSEALRDFSASFWCYAFSPPLRIGRTMCPKLCRISAMHSRITDVFTSAPLPDPLASQGLGPRSGRGFGPELGSPLGVEPLI
ncbi:hypothetical protein GGX14DRAFT_396633 [Mycena pura]|uniref:Retrotransposon gag domain-containing protein n=1 Tax=Mycena pura TaxID=153505 RepID=A0AAD6Y9N2_9AGAR|nr:hypothetical protein GGX14DRAFT_396633 [Mycena pura]